MAVSAEPSRTKPPRVPTFTAHALKQLVPAMGWQAVYYDTATGAHFLSALDFLALAIPRTCECHASYQPVRETRRQEDEGWEIVSVEYSPSDGWMVAEESGNFCGQLPPEMTLETWETLRHCGHAVLDTKKD